MTTYQLQDFTGRSLTHEGRLITWEDDAVPPYLFEDSGHPSYPNRDVTCPYVLLTDGAPASVFPVYSHAVGSDILWLLLRRALRKETT